MKFTNRRMWFANLRRISHSRFLTEAALKERFLGSTLAIVERKDVLSVTCWTGMSPVLLSYNATWHFSVRLFFMEWAAIFRRCVFSSTRFYDSHCFRTSLLRAISIRILKPLFSFIFLYFYISHLFPHTPNPSLENCKLLLGYKGVTLSALENSRWILSAGEKRKTFTFDFLVTGFVHFVVIESESLQFVLEDIVLATDSDCSSIFTSHRWKKEDYTESDNLTLTLVVKNSIIII